MRHRGLAVVGAIAAMASVGVATAQADTTTSDYPTTTDARTFAGSVGGWQSAKFDAGLTCLLKPLTCPIVTNTWQSSGGLAKTVRRRGYGLRTISLRVRPTNNGWARNLVAHNRRLHAKQTIKAHHQSQTRNAALKVVAFKKP